MQINRRHLAAAGAFSLLSLGASSVALADDDKNKKKGKLDDASVGVAVEAFRVAMQKADKKAFEALTSDQLSYGHSAGKLENKAEFIAGSTNGKSTWKTIAFNNVSNHVVGKEAISRFTLVGQTESEGKTTDINIGVLMVWREEKGAWKLLARQAFKL